MPELSDPRSALRSVRVDERLDTASFFKTMGDMERETEEMKAVYQKEIDALIKQLDDMARQKNHYIVQSEQHEAYAEELKKTLELEIERSRNIADQADVLQRALNNNEKDLQTAVASAANAAQSIEVRSRDRRIDELLRENADLRKRSDAENLKRLEVEDKLLQLQKTMEFRTEVHERETGDFRERFAAASRAVLDLEERLRDLESASRMQAAVLVDARDMSARELARYKHETEQSFSRTLAALKAQIDADNESFDKVTNENKNLGVSLAESNDNIKRLHGQIDQLRHQVKSLEESLSSERERAIKHARSLENKLKDAQDMLFDKLQEINYMRSRSVPLWVSPDPTLQGQDNRSRMVVIPPILNKGSLASLEDARGRSLAPTSSADSFGNVPLLGRPTSLNGRPVSEAAFTRTSSADKGNSEIDKRHSESPMIERYQGQQLRYDKLPVKRTAAGGSRPVSSVSHDYNNCTNSATGEIRIQEVQEEGRFIRLFNDGKKDVDIGNYTLQQNVGGSPVAVYQFPPRLTFAAGSSVTVYAGCNDQLLHQPPVSFVWKEQQRWGYGPECTSILRKPNGQAVAWMTAAHRFGKMAANSGGRSHSRDGINSSGLKFALDSEADGSPSRPCTASSRQSDGTGRAAGVETTRGFPQNVVRTTATAAMSLTTLSGPSPPDFGLKVQAQGKPATAASLKTTNAATTRYGQPSPFHSPLQQQYARATEEHSTSLVHFA